MKAIYAHKHIPNKALLLGDHTSLIHHTMLTEEESNRMCCAVKTEFQFIFLVSFFQFHVQ